MTPTEHAIAVITGIGIGLLLLAPLGYGLYRIDKHLNDRTRERKAAERRAMRRHPAGQHIDVVESSAYNPRRAA